LFWGTILAIAGAGVASEVYNHYKKVKTIGQMKSELPKGAKILNCGCKNFFTTDSYFEITNIDIIPRNVPNFVLADVRDLSTFPDKSFDGAFISHVLEHIPAEDVDKALSELNRVVRDPKRIYILLPTPATPTAWLCPTHKWLPIGDKRIPVHPILNWGTLVGSLALTRPTGKSALMLPIIPSAATVWYIYS